MTPLLFLSYPLAILGAVLQAIKVRGANYINEVRIVLVKSPGGDPKSPMERSAICHDVPFVTSSDVPSAWPPVAVNWRATPMAAKVGSPATFRFTTVFGEEPVGAVGELVPHVAVAIRTTAIKTTSGMRFIMEFPARLTGEPHRSVLPARR